MQVLSETIDGLVGKRLKCRLQLHDKTRSLSSSGYTFNIEILKRIFPYNLSESVMEIFTHTHLPESDRNVNYLGDKFLQYPTCKGGYQGGRVFVVLLHCVRNKGNVNQ